ncbi:MAG TPA: MATE family efflux transporter [Thermoanaerobaculia bacterium]|nr:MATE family efflux transporter [Thermoanaerobaculia bacterium]
MHVEGYKAELGRLLRLAAPLAAAQAGTQLMGLVDVAVLGRLGARELAGSGLANALFFAFSIFGMGIVFGVDPLISQALGAGDRVRARRVLWQGMWLGLIVSAVLTVLMLILIALFPLIGSKPELIEPARTYLILRTTSIVPFILFFVARAYLQAHGVTRPMVWSMIAANVLNLFADILLVFGGSKLPAWTGPLREIPAMGVAGAAIATVLCQILQFVIVLLAVRSVPVDGHVEHRWNGAEVMQAFRVGLPVALQMGAEVGVFALVGVLASRLGVLQLAAHQLVIGLASFTFTVALGIAAAGSVRVGLGVGARDSAATRISGHVTFVGGAAVMAFSGLMFAIAPRPIIRLVTDQQDVILASIPLMLVAAVFQLSDGVQAVGAGVLRGAGDTKYAFVANIFGHWCVGLPIALLLGFHYDMGIVGLWWGLCAGLTVVAVLLFLRFEKISARGIVPIENAAPSIVH